MSALNVFATDEAIEIYTDGAWLADDGTVGEVGEKVLAFPHMPAAVAVRGGSYWLTILYERINRRFADFDALVGGIVPALRNLPGEYGPLRKVATAQRVEFTFAGWSKDRGKAVAFSLCNQARDGVPAWDMRETVRAIAPTSDALMATMKGAGVDFLAFKPVTTQHAIALMAAQRAMAEKHGTATVGFVGAFCQRTVVTQDEITMRIVKRWPDRIGKPITI